MDNNSNSRSMWVSSVCYYLLFLCCCVLLILGHSSYSQELPRSEREALEIIIGGGGGTDNPAPSPDCGCQEPTLPPPPPPATCPPPLSPPLTAPKPKPSPPPPPPRPPQPSKFFRLERAQKALLNFKHTIINDTTGYTNNWIKGGDTCKFRGILCSTFPDDKRPAVAGLDFNGARFSGKNLNKLTVSGILSKDKIPELAFFHVNSNNFTGNIPFDISTFKYFYELDLSNNKLTGSFPQEVLSFTQLVFLDLRFNSLSGSLPPKLFQLDLDVIFVNNNKLTGSLPYNFGSTPARFLTFANNQFSGSLPPSVGRAGNLTEVLFLGNQFSGCLPYEIGYLKKTTVFDVSKNLLTGPIPHSFACLEKIQYLNLGENKFYNEVPERVCQLPGLRNNGNLNLSCNYFTQVGPECRKLIESKVLDVSRNCIFGLPNQRPHNECSEFFSKVKPCPNPKSFTFVPCGKYYSPTAAETTLSSDAAAAAPAPAPLTYKALKPHRL